jgi:hypothetical protein
MVLSLVRLHRGVAMPHMKSACGILLLLSCLPLAVQAASDKEKPRLQEDKAPCQEKKPLPPRRAVPLVIERVPPVAPPARTGVPVVVPPVNTPSPPPAVSGCDGGGCWDSGGSRYNGSNGVYLNGAGRQCQRVGTSLQCF